MPGVKIVPVASVTFHRDVAFAAVCRDKYDGGVGLSGSGSPGGGAVGGGGHDLRAVLRSLSLDRIGRSDKVWVLCCAGSPAVEGNVSQRDL